MTQPTLPLGKLKKVNPFAPCSGRVVFVDGTASGWDAFVCSVPVVGAEAVSSVQLHKAPAVIIPAQTARRRSSANAMTPRYYPAGAPLSRNNEMAKYGAVSEIVGPVDRVVVVGAGIAGLAAASRLRRAGIACVVLEARDRIGGRLHTVDLSGVPVDLGGSWIHHPIGNPISTLCDEYAITRDPGDPTPALSAYDRAERRRLDHGETETYSRQESDAFWDAVDALSDRLGPDATGLDAIEAYVAERGFTGAVARRVRQALRAEVEADAGDRADNNSLRWMTYGDEFEGPVLGELPRDGYRSVVGALASGLDVRFNTEVVSVEAEADGIRVRCADGSVETGSHAIVTVPAWRAQARQPAIRPAAARAGAKSRRRTRVRPLREDRTAVRVGILARRRDLAPDGVPVR